MKVPDNMIGLTNDQVIASRQEKGSNTLEMEEDRVLLLVLKEVILEPMFILLLAACVIYFVLGKYSEGVIMLVAILLVAGISLFQEYRSKNAIRALKKLSESHAKVRRNGTISEIPSEDIVVKDLLLLEEGDIVAADGLITSANDLSLNESIITGESLGVSKLADNNSYVFKGTLVTSGSATIAVSEVGLNTVFGKIGLSLKEIKIVKTPLQQQIRLFVRNMVWIGTVAFFVVVGYHFYHSGNLINSFLQGLTLAMSILPEEIPVAFSTFQALGAFRLLRNNIIVKQPQYVETLGSATVICADKTGTLTQNKMSIAFVYEAVQKRSYTIADNGPLPEALIEYAMWSSETSPFDPMEKAIHDLYLKTTLDDKRPSYAQIQEYPISGKPPMMTHIFRSTSGDTVIAVKGGLESILSQCGLPKSEKDDIERKALSYAKLGYRVLGVGKGEWKGEPWPQTQFEFDIEFLGLMVFHDPPKDNIIKTLQTFNDAGISVKMITGDYAETALAIANQIHLEHHQEVLTGQEVMNLDSDALQGKVSHVNIFARMFPEAKLKVINALRANGEVVAMTGDGVNDAPALKAAHIGIAMGQRGSEVAKNAASLIITDDDLAHMTEAVALGRKIFDNLKKAIQYIVSIHIPIILIVTLPLLLGWKFVDIFSPVHVIFLELIMGPTCSIIYENEPMEEGTMSRPPKKMNNNLLSFKQLLVSIIQGLMITAACLGTGYYFLANGAAENNVRTIIFTVLLCSNIFLTLVNRSFYFSVFKTLEYENKLLPFIIGITIVLVSVILFVPYVSDLFRIQQLSLMTFCICILMSAISTLWIEIWKYARRKKYPLGTVNV
jgi:Ca2+-transporting ATPase